MTRLKFEIDVLQREHALVAHGQAARPHRNHGRPPSALTITRVSKPQHAFVAAHERIGADRIVVEVVDRLDPGAVGQGARQFGAVLRFAEDRAHVILARQPDEVVDVLRIRLLPGREFDRADRADAGIAVATLGSQAGGATTTNAGPDIITWASSSGAYAGISLNGTVITPNTNEDARFYGRPLTSGQIVSRHGPAPAGAAALISAVNSQS